MQDGKVDTTDIPDIVLLVIECSNNLGSFNLTYNELPEVLEEFINYLLERFDVIPDDQEESFKRMVSMIVKLVMLKPKVKKACLSLANKINIFKSCKK